MEDGSPAAPELGHELISFGRFQTVAPAAAPAVAAAPPIADEPLRPAARRYLIAIVAVATVAAAVALATIDPTAGSAIALAVGLAVVTFLVALLPLSLGEQTKVHLDTGLLVAAVLLLDPGLALLTTLGAIALAHRLRREPWDVTLFNLAQAALQVIAGGGVLALAGWRVSDLGFSHPSAIAVAAAVGVGVWALSVLLVIPMAALQMGERPSWIWLRSLFSPESAVDLAQVGLGLVLAAISAVHQTVVALLLVPVGAIYWALASHVQRSRDAERRLRHRATHDPLTDLPNRALFLERLAEALRRPRRRGDRVSVLFVDLDRFKFVNDSLGHPAGDQLLIALARRLEAAARPHVVARMGGDEFTVLVESGSVHSPAEATAEAIVRALSAPLHLDHHQVAVTASVGIAHAVAGATSAEVLRDADMALYRAKREGKARWAVFNLGLDAAARDQVALEVDLKHAVERGELRLALQPVVHLRTDRLVAMEALVRWQHPARGLLAPDLFIPLAEETGLILPIGRWVLAEACRQARGWQTADCPVVVSVNLSARQFLVPALVAEIAAALAATDLPADRLRLEITESTMMSDAEGAVATLRQIRNLGARIAIDDFGTGYSSLGYLRRFPVDLLKVDRSFVTGIGRAGEDATIVRAMVGLAHSLGMEVVAEGVETRQQSRRLRDLGCDLGQGFYFSPPIPAEAVPTLLTRAAAAPLRAAVGD